MRLERCFFILAASFLLFTQTLFGQAEFTWERVEGPYGYVPLNLMWIDSSGSLWMSVMHEGHRRLVRSSDDGLNWQDTEFEFSPIGATVSPEGTIFLLFEDGIIRRSVDDGATWEQLPPVLSFFPFENHVYALSNSVLYVGGRSDDGNGLFRSTDAGMTWENVLPGFTPPLLTLRIGSRVLMFDRDSLYHLHDDDPDPRAIRSMPMTGGVSLAPDGNVYAMNSAGEMFVSPDSGLTWQPTAVDRPGSGHTLLISRQGTMFITMNQDVDISRDGGSTWNVSALKYGPNTPVGFTEFFESPAGSIFARGSRELLRSTDDGESWQESTRGIYGMGINRAYVDASGNLILGTESAGILTSTDNGSSWRQYYDSASIQVGAYHYDAVIFDITATESGTIFASANSSLFRSEDMGITWENIAPLRLSASEIEAGGSVLLARRSKILLRSYDKGITWDTVVRNSPPRSLLYNPIREEFLGIQPNGDWVRSSDEGRTWNLLLPASGDTISMHVDPLMGDLYAVTTASGHDEHLRVRLSFDNGSTWHDMSQGLEGVRQDAGFFVTEKGDHYLSTEDSVIYHSSPGLSSWAPLQGNNVKFVARSFHKLGDGRLLAVTQYDALYVSSRPVLSVPDREVAGVSSLLVPYPNPARDFVVVGGIPSDERIVSATLSNVLGEKVCVWSNEDVDLNADGVRLDMSGLSDGFYLLRMHSVSGRMWTTSVQVESAE